MAIREGKLDNLTPEELDRRAHEHIDGFFEEMKGAAGLLKARYHPVSIARRHPVGTAVVVGVGALLLARMIVSRPSAKPAPPPSEAGRSFRGSLFSSLAGAVGRLLPEILLMIVAQRAMAGNKESPLAQAFDAAQRGGR